MGVDRDAGEGASLTWYIRGEAYACCSCSVGCPCAVGEMETAGSIGCSAVQVVDIAEGEIRGTDVGGAKLAAVVDWPGPMMAGNGTGRLYFDVETSPEQREALEELISGKLGGVFAAIPMLVPKTLPPKVAPITMSTGAEGTSISVGEFGAAIVKPMSSPTGEPVRLRGAGGFREEVVLATGNGSWWRDPELREWEGGGYAEQTPVAWDGQG